MGSTHWWLVVVVLALWGCSSDGSADAPDPAPDPDPVELAGPGDPLAEGFVVPDGAQLLAPPVPLANWSYEGVEAELAWEARLYAEEPGLAFAGLAGQAADMGFELRAPGAPCRFELDGFDPKSRPRSMSCTADGWRTVDGKEEHVLATVQRLPAPRWFGRPTAHASMRFTRWPEGIATPRSSDVAGSIPEEVYDPLFDVDLWVPPLGPGDQFSTSLRTDATVEEGSRVVAPVEGPICDHGFRVVLDVTGDPDEVFERYAQQIHRWADEFGYEVEERESTLFGRDVREAHSRGGVASTTYTATMVSGPGDAPARILYEYCGG